MNSINLIITLFVVVLCFHLTVSIKLVICSDPGLMFGLDAGAGQEEQPQMQDLSPIGWFGTDNSIPTTSTINCSTGTSIVLKRIVSKLFNHINLLQPNELDDEYLYHSTLTYHDYIALSKLLGNKEIDCGQLHLLNRLISNFISRAQVQRPRNQNYFWELFNSFTMGGSISRTIQLWPDLHVSFTLLCVAIMIFLFRKVLHYRELPATILGILIPGFIQFYVHEHNRSLNNHLREIQRCQNPSYVSNVLAFFNLGDNCNLDQHPPELKLSNVSKLLVQYLFDLILDPIVTFATKVGQASEAFLSSYTGLDRIFFGPIFLGISYACITIITCCLVKFVIFMYFAKSDRKRQPAIKGPKKKSIENNKNKRN